MVEVFSSNGVPTGWNIAVLASFLVTVIRELYQEDLLSVTKKGIQYFHLQLTLLRVLSHPAK